MPITHNVFTNEWQKAIRMATPEQQKWFVAGVFGLKKPESVDASKIEVAYNSDNDKYVITAREKHSSFGRVKYELKNAELQGQDLQKLIERITPSKPENNPQNIYSSPKPPKNAPPPIPTQADQYGVLPRRKAEVEATQNYGPVGPEPATTPFNPTTTSSSTTIYSAMPTLTSPPSVQPKERQAQSATLYGTLPADNNKLQSAILKSAAAQYGSASKVNKTDVPVVYGSMPPTDDIKSKGTKPK